MRLYLVHCAILLLLVAHSARGQGISGKDSAQAENDLKKKYASLFGPAWSNMFVQSWNMREDTAKLLSGLGKVYFISVGKETASALMEFDSLGFVTYRSSKLPGPTDSIPRFTAKLIRWAEFMEGKFRAVAGVLSRRIEYLGPMTIAFRYGFYFDKVAPVGRRIAEVLSQKEKDNPSPRKHAEQHRKTKKK